MMATVAAMWDAIKGAVRRTPGWATFDRLMSRCLGHL